MDTITAHTSERAQPTASRRAHKRNKQTRGLCEKKKKTVQTCIRRGNEVLTLMKIITAIITSATLLIRRGKKLLREKSVFELESEILAGLQKNLPITALSNRR